MKFFILILTSLFSFSSFAHINIEGCYNYSQIEILQVQHHIPVYTKSKSGQLKLKELKANKFSCSAKANSWYLCKKIINKNSVSPEQMESKVSGNPVELCFDELREEPSLISKGDSLSIWQYEQDSYTLEWESPRFEYWQYSNNTLTKIKITDTQEKNHYYVLEEESGKNRFKDIQSFSVKRNDGFFRVLLSQIYQ